MTQDIDKQRPWEKIRDLVDAEAGEALHDYLEELSPGELARSFTMLDEEEHGQLLALLEPEDAADIIEELYDVQGADIIEELPREQAAAIVDEMESDYRADILAEMDEEDAEEILREMDPEEAEDARMLLEYEDDTAGGIMVTEFVVYPVNISVAAVLADMRDNAEQYSDYGVQYAYVESLQGTLVGVLRLRDLVLAPSAKLLQDIMITNPIYATAEMDIEELDRLFDRFSFWSMPVTDTDGKLVGVVRRADMEEALGEEQGRDFLRFSGIIGGEELRSMPLKERVSRRMVWLLLNVFLSFVAASVILFFEDTLINYSILIFFIPVVGNMSGCSGNQAVAVSIRELALGLIQPSDFMRVWSKELAVGFFNGIVIGIAIGGLAFILQQNFENISPSLPIIIGLAFALNALISVSLGGLIPLALRYVKLDPALGAPPILTTLADMCSLIILFGLVSLAVSLGWV